MSETCGKRWVRILLGLQLCLLGWGGCRHSPTYDEVAHLPAGLSHWELGDFRLFRVNPPLVRMVAALPVWLLGAETDWSRLEAVVQSRSEKRIDFDLGRDFITVNGERAFWLYTYGRWACLPFVLAGGWVVWRWSRDLYGETAGVLAATIWSVSPLVLGHGQLLTPDVAAASLGALAFYSYWQWTKRPSWSMAYLAGLALGLALLAKTTWIIVGPLMFLLWLVVVANPHRQWLCEVSQFVLIPVVAWLVLVIGYGGDGLFKPLGEYSFQSRVLGGPPTGERGEAGSDAADSGTHNNRFAATWLAVVPVPLPEQYVKGIDVQKSNFESQTLSYLRGELRRGGWWYYYLYAVGVKSTLGGLLLLICVTGIRLLGMGRVAPRVPRGDEWFVLAPLIALAWLISSQTGINKHLRYFLPAYPFAIIWLSQAATLAASVRTCRWRRRLRGGVVASTTWAAVSSLWIYPHSMSYFNELAGGPRNGDRHLINSNIDWGQDLFFLRDKLETLGWDDVGMVYWGRYDARLAGVNYRLPPPGPFEKISEGRGRRRSLATPGQFAISVNHLRGYAFVAPDGHGGLATPRRDAYRYFQQWQPVGSVGYSMRLFDVSAADIERMREGLGDGGLPRVRLSKQREFTPSGPRPRVIEGVPNTAAYFVGYTDGSVRRFGLTQTGDTGDRDGDPRYLKVAGIGVTSLACSPTADRVAIGLANGDLFVGAWAAGGRGSTIRFGSHSAAINAIAFSPDGLNLASASDDGTITLWAAGRGDLLLSIACKLNATAVAWLDDGHLIVGTGDWRTGRRGVIAVYDVRGGKPVKQMQDSQHFIVDLVTFTGDRVIGRSSSGELAIWNAINGEKLLTLVGNSPRPLAMANDPGLLAAGDSRGNLLLWELASGDLIVEAQHFKERIVDIALVGREPVLVAVDERGTLKHFTITQQQ